MGLVEKCREIAEKAHKGQVRRFGADRNKPYVIHPERVAARFSKDEALAAVAWLHDVAEDTDVGADGILCNSEIPRAVAHAVIDLTRKKDETYFDFIVRIANSPMAAPVKMADLEDNMTSLEEGSLKDKYRFALDFLKKAGYSIGG